MAMMVVKKRCQYCGKLFIPDKRIGTRQKACSAECQKLRKKDNNRAFGKNNPGYWRGRYSVTKEWRQSHPGYQRQWRQGRAQRMAAKKPREIQAELFVKALDAVEKNVSFLREIQAEIQLQVIETIAVKACCLSRHAVRYKPRCR
jgi:predicted nucleic acid-binding Zn ribbon protein